jgi:hypothetical protein
VKQQKSAEALLGLINAEMANYDTCADVKATSVVPINDGRFDVTLRASGVPAETAKPTVHVILHKLNQRYRLTE